MFRDVFFREINNGFPRITTQFNFKFIEQLLKSEKWK